jgi:hypothetical protein
MRCIIKWVVLLGSDLSCALLHGRFPHLLKNNLQPRTSEWKAVRKEIPSLLLDIFAKLPVPLSASARLSRACTTIEENQSFSASPEQQPGQILLETKIATGHF